MTERGLKNINVFYSTFRNVFFIFVTFFNVFFIFSGTFFYIYAPVPSSLIAHICQSRHPLQQALSRDIENAAAAAAALHNDVIFSRSMLHQASPLLPLYTSGRLLLIRRHLSAFVPNAAATAASVQDNMPAEITPNLL